MKTIVEKCVEALESGQTHVQIEHQLKSQGFHQTIINNAINEAEARIHEKKLPKNKKQFSFLQKDIDAHKKVHNEIGVTTHDELKEFRFKKEKIKTPYPIISMIVIVAAAAIFFSIFVTNQNEPIVGAAVGGFTGENAKKFCLQNIHSNSFYTSNKPPVDLDRFCDLFSNLLFFERDSKEFERVVNNNCNDLTLVKSRIIECKQNMRKMYTSFENAYN